MSAANVLNYMPKSVQPRAKRDLHEIYLAETKEEAEKAFGTFLEKYGPSALVTGALLARLALLRDASGITSPDKIQMLVDGFPVERGASYLAMATTLDRLFLRLQPFWGEGPGNLRFTAISDEARDLARAMPGILRGRPGARVTEDNGYLSRNARRASLLFDCGFTVDGELLPPRPGQIAFLTAEDRVRFVRA